MRDGRGRSAIFPQALALTDRPAPKVQIVPLVSVVCRLISAGPQEMARMVLHVLKAQIVNLVFVDTKAARVILV